MKAKQIPFVRIASIVFAISFSSITLFAQSKKAISFGKVTAEDFKISSPLIDSNTNAVVVSDEGELNFEGNDKG